MQPFLLVCSPEIGAECLEVPIWADRAGNSTMKCTPLTAKPMIRKLKIADHLPSQGQTVADAYRVLSVSQSTYHRWRLLYGGMKAEVELEKGMRKDLGEGNF
jgi:hypothetical protein